MISQVLFNLRRLSRRLWVRASIISALAIVAAAISPLLTPLMPARLFAQIEADTVRALLDILANSMLAVTTFSLTIMVTTHLTASQQVTPRAHRVLREDTRTQTVLATFVGTFVFSVSAIVMMQTGVIGQETYPVLYITTLAVLALVIIAILRWIGHLASLGSVEETTLMVENLAREALERRLRTPFLGGHEAKLRDDHEVTHAVQSPASGFIQHIDTAKLSEIISDIPMELQIDVMPGKWVSRGDKLATAFIADMDQEMEDRLATAFTIGSTRTFEQDAAFGITVLSEIAQRALSPSMNDPGTAKDIIARLLVILEDWQDEVEPDKIDAPNVYVARQDVAPLIDAAFSPIARDGAENAEVALYVQLALTRLANHRSPAIAEAARISAGHALAYAEARLLLEADKVKVRAAAPEALRS